MPPSCIEWGWPALVSSRGTCLMSSKIRTGANKVMWSNDKGRCSICCESNISWDTGDLGSSGGRWGMPRQPPAPQSLLPEEWGCCYPCTAHFPPSLPTHPEGVCEGPQHQLTVWSLSLWDGIAPGLSLFRMLAGREVGAFWALNLILNPAVSSVLTWRLLSTTVLVDHSLFFEACPFLSSQDLTHHWPLCCFSCLHSSHRTHGTEVSPAPIPGLLPYLQGFHDFFPLGFQGIF